VKGNSGADFGADSLDYVCFNTAEELTEQWQTFNYAIIGDGTTRTYYISFTGMDTSVEIADLQIAPAIQFADLRQRDAMLTKLKAYKNAYNWDPTLLDDFAITETIANLEAIGDESSQGDLDGQLVTAREVLNEFLKENMDDYIPAGNVAATTNGAGTPNVDNKVSTWVAKLQKAYTFGDWHCLPDGRGFWENNGTPFDLGHFQQSATWGNGAPTAPMGLYMQKVMDPGSYVFAVNAGGAFRENKKNSWNNDDGMKPCYGVAYAVKIVDGAATDTIAVQIQDVSSTFQIDDDSQETRQYLGLTPFIITAQIAEAGTYEFGIKVYCKEAYQTLARGSVAYVINPSLWGKNENKYNQRQLAYEADVLEQITTGRTQLTTAAENLANAEAFWGKAELQACVDTVETKIAAYEALSQDDIIATYEDYYEKTTANDNGLMTYEVYQAATKDIIAANRRFTALNDTLNSIQVAISAAEDAKAMRIYNASTGAAALDAAIASAKGVQANMKAAQYSEENAAAIVAANAALEEAVETFKASVPASAMTVIADIDFANVPVLDEETQTYTVAGAVNSMVLPSFSDEAGTTFGQGWYVNGEKTLADIMRLGNGEGLVSIPAEQQVSGTNILKIDFDIYYGNLSGKNAGFYLYGDTTTVAGFFVSKYSGTAVTNTFNLDYSDKYIPKVGASNAANEVICVENNRTHFEVVLDYGEKAMYCKTTAKGVSQTSEKIVLPEDKVVSFGIKSDYNNADRRCWFDNVKIVCLTAPATTPFVPTAIQEVNEAAKVVAPKKVLKNGRIVIDGKYGLNGMIIK